MLPPESRWFGLVGIAIGNALPIYLVWGGQLQFPDLVLAYCLEALMAYVVWLVSRPDHRSVAFNTEDRWKLRLFLLVGLLLVAPGLTIYTMSFVTWDIDSVWVVGVALGSSLVGYIASIRRKGTRWREGLGGSFAWRFWLLMVALMAASSGRGYERLTNAGWEPHRIGNGWALPAGELLTRLALAAELSPVVVAAGLLCAYRLVSELLYEIFDIFRDEASDAEKESKAAYLPEHV